MKANELRDLVNTKYREMYPGDRLSNTKYTNALIGVIASFFPELPQKEERKKEYKTFRILRNRAYCNKCNATIESTHRHDFVTCPCGAISVDGGHDYLRRVGNIEDISDISEVEDI